MKLRSNKKYCLLLFYQHYAPNGARDKMFRAYKKTPTKFETSSALVFC